MTIKTPYIVFVYSLLYYYRCCEAAAQHARRKQILLAFACQHMNHGSPVGEVVLLRDK
jgi:hypothetical protein